MRLCEVGTGELKPMKEELRHSIGAPLIRSDEIKVCCSLTEAVLRFSMDRETVTLCIVVN